MNSNDKLELQNLFSPEKAKSENLAQAGNFEESIAELAEWVRIHGSAEGFVYSKSQVVP